jgi:Txe/YoeB family toxin of Txe-Axe toxin-antitoxin module
MEKEHLEMILEDISGKFDLVLEGHAALDRKMTEGFSHLNEKIETNSFKIDVLNKKIDGVAAELRAHRADTEAHRGVYGVRED